MQIANPKAFTLTELLVVVGIMVMLFGMGAAAFRAITGSRSVAVAQNQVAAMLAQVRNLAIAKQDTRGVAFYRSVSNGRIGMAVVYYSNLAANQINIVSNIDPQLLPAGVGVTAFCDSSVTGYRYLIPDQTPSSSPQAGSSVVLTPAVIFFDSSGRLLVSNYTIPASTTLYNLCGLSAAPTAIPSQIALALFDQESFRGNPSTCTDWLDQNATPLLVNRYNGTLIKAE